MTRRAAALRILMAVLISLVLNILLLVLSASVDPGQPRSAFARAVDFAYAPGFYICQRLFSNANLSSLVILLFFCSTAWYSLAAWVVLVLAAWVHSSIGKRQRKGGKEAEG